MTDGSQDRNGRPAVNNEDLRPQVQWLEAEVDKLSTLVPAYIGTIRRQRIAITILGWMVLGFAAMSLAQRFGWVK